MAFALSSIWSLLQLVAVAILPLARGRPVSTAVKSGYPVAEGLCAVSVIPFGYKCEEFQVKTEDGYILGIQRISQGRATGRSTSTATGPPENKQPVIIQHGVLVDGSTWFLNGAEENLPLILADNGFDVWIANTRGTRFSRTHLTLDPHTREYWSWSWDELAAYDLPATFELVYSHTSHKIHYVGHSLGTLMILGGLSEGRLVNRVRSAALLSPVAYLSHMTTALGILAADVFVGEMITVAGVAEFNPKGEQVARFVKKLCWSPGVHCYDILTALTGENCCLNSSTVEVFLQNEPQSTSVKNMVHLAQTVRYGVLAKYNYARPDYNLQHYGDIRPPIYNLSKIPHDLPLFLSYGGKDALSDTKDVETLLDLLKLHDVDKLAMQFIKDYAHADFIMGINANNLVYNDIIRFFQLH